MALTDAKLRLIVNQLADSGTAHAAAHILAAEAKERGLLVSELLAGLGPPTPAAPGATPAPPPEPDPEDSIDVAIGKRIDSATYGLQAEVHHESEKAWLVTSPVGGPEVWLPKSQVEHHGEDAIGRAIFILPTWLARKKGFI